MAHSGTVLLAKGLGREAAAAAGEAWRILHCSQCIGAGSSSSSRTTSSARKAASWAGGVHSPTAQASLLAALPFTECCSGWRQRCACGPSKSSCRSNEREGWQRRSRESPWPPPPPLPSPTTLAHCHCGICSRRRRSLSPLHTHSHLQEFQPIPALAIKHWPALSFSLPLFPPKKNMKCEQGMRWQQTWSHCPAAAPVQDTLDPVHAPCRAQHKGAMATTLGN